MGSRHVINYPIFSSWLHVTAVPPWFLGDRRRAWLSIASINGHVRTARGCGTVALSPSICSAPTGWNPAVCATRKDPPSASRGRTFVHSWLRHRNNSTAIFLALCRVSVTNGSFSKRREATRQTWRT